MEVERINDCTGVQGHVQFKDSGIENNVGGCTKFYGGFKDRPDGSEDE